MQLLDIINLKDGKSLTGVIDYASTKQLYFFNFSNETHIDYLLLAILWKGHKPNLRFSVFCALEYPDLTLPPAVLIPISNIQTTNKDVNKPTKVKQRKRTLKFGSMK